MVKNFLIVLLSAILLTGCSSKKSNSAAQIAYEGYYNAISDYASVTDVGKFTGSSDYYKINCEMSQLPDGTYRYYVFVDEPQIAMYDIVLLAVEDDVPYAESVKMMPSVGIFDTKYSMLPFQSNAEGGFVKGLVLSGESTNPEVNLKVLVEWSNKNHDSTTREFLSYTVTMEGFTHTDNAEDEVIPAEEGTVE